MGDNARSQEAIRQIWTLLERKHKPALVLGNPEFYEVVPEVLHAENLRDDEEKELAAEIKRLVTSTNSEIAHIGLIGLLSMTAPWIGIGPVLDLIYTHTPRYTDEEARQLVIALDRVLDICPAAAGASEHDEFFTGRAGEVLACLRERDPRDLLTAMARSRGRRAAEAARLAWRHAQLLLGTPEEVRALRDAETENYSLSGDFVRAHLMKPVLRQLVVGAGDSSDPVRQGEAISEIATLLKARKCSSPAAPQARLPARLRGLSFTFDDEMDLRAEVRELLFSTDSTSVRLGLMAALRETAAANLFPLLELLISHAAALTDEELRRLLEVLDEGLLGFRLSEMHEDEEWATGVAYTLRMTDPLRVLAGLADSRDRQVRSLASSITESVEFAATIIPPRP